MVKENDNRKISFFSFNKLSTGRKIIMFAGLTVGIIAIAVCTLIDYKILKDEAKGEAVTYAQSIASNIRVSLGNCVGTAEIIEDLYQENPDIFLENFDGFSGRILEDDELISCMYLAPEGIVEYVYPDEYENSYLGFDILKDPNEAQNAQLAIDRKNTVISGPHEMTTGDKGLIIRRAIYDENGDFTVLVGMVLDWDRLVDKITMQIVSADGKYRYGVWKDDGNVINDEYGFLFRNTEDNVSRDLNIEFGVLNDTWNLAVEPVGGWVSNKIIVRDIVLGLVILIAGLFCIYARMIRTTRNIYALQFDDLTGIYTRSAFYYYYDRMLKLNPGRDYDVVIADVENFKMINSLYGDNQADNLLKYLAGCYKIRTPGAVYARYGGDQFVCLLPSSDKENAEDFIRNMQAIADNAPIHNIKINYGYYGHIDRSLSVSAVCDRALLAAKSVKHNYEKILATYQGSVAKEQERNQMLEAEFEGALKRGEFKVWYQPKFDAASGKIVGAEALVRWERKNGEIISPGTFIHLFEEDGQINKLDAFVFKEVCTGIKIWMTQGYNVFPVSVNLSRSSLAGDDLISDYRRIVEDVGIPTKYVPLELTESAAFHSRQIKDKANELKDIGFVLHMDDFGSGFSSLASLNILPFDVVKLDKTLIDLVGDPGGNEILRHTIELAHFKKMTVVAEGVETEEQVEFLKKNGCDVLQGFYFATPKEYDDFIKYIGEEYRKGNII